MVEDPAAAVALAATYNDWLAEYCAADPRRLFGAAMLPLQDPAAAAGELRRAVTELGLVAGFVRPNPCLGRALSDRAYDVVWDAAEELGVPIGIHEGSSVIVPTLGADRPFNPLLLHAVSHSFEAMLACAELIAFGTLERHPGLRLLFLESSGGWAPFWLERLDEQAESFGGFCPDMALRPSEYFARQCAISFEVDERTLPALAPFVGEDRIVWGSDYPHHDATFPGAVDAIRATVSPCTTAAQVHVLGLNARRLYWLPSRRTGLPGLIDDYFTAVTAQEIDLVRALFRPDAVFESGDVRLQGLDAICGYYTANTFTFEDFRPGSRDSDLRRHAGPCRHRRAPGRSPELGARRVRDGRHAHHRAPRQRVRRGVAHRRAEPTGGLSQAGWGCGPRRSRPGLSPVASSCSRTTVPDFTVATYPRARCTRRLPDAGRS